MRRNPLTLIALALVAVGLLRAFDGGQGDAPAAARPRASAPEKHYVTPVQLTATGEWTGRPAPPLTAVAQDGKSYALADLADGRPVVVVFIKDGCPCSADAEPFFARLRAAYGDRLRFAGVIDGRIEAARAYATAARVPYPVLTDPDKAIIRSYRAENSVYVALVRPDGVIDTLWPGYSAEMLQDLGGRVACLAGTAEVPLDLRGAPAVLTTGCPF
jgi:peroxiredoxin